MDTNSASYREIQSECKRLGLRAVGPREDLVKRLESYTSCHQNSFTPQSQQHTEFQPSQVDRAENHDEEGIPEMPTNALVPVERARGENSGGEICDWSVERRRDPRSTHAVAIMESTEKTLAISRQLRESQVKEIAEQQLLLNSIGEALRSMTVSLGSYHHERNRFLSTFKKDKLGRATRDDLRIIAGGKVLAQAGDAATDALLYEGTNGRRDFTTYQKLYGLQPETVRKLRHSETFIALNIHASVLASYNRTGSPTFYNLFNDFIRLFTDSGMGCDEGYLVGDPTEVTKAYRAFFACIKTQVTWVAPELEKL